MPTLFLIVALVSLRTAPAAEVASGQPADRPAAPPAVTAFGLLLGCLNQLGSPVSPGANLTVESWGMPPERPVPADAQTAILGGQWGGARGVFVIGPKGGTFPSRTGWAT